MVHGGEDEGALALGDGGPFVGLWGWGRSGSGRGSAVLRGTGFGGGECWACGTLIIRVGVEEWGRVGCRSV